MFGKRSTADASTGPASRPAPQAGSGMVPVLSDAEPSRTAAPPRAPEPPPMQVSAKEARKSEEYFQTKSMIFGALIVFFLIVEPHGLARLWLTAREKLRLWPFPH